MTKFTPEDLIDHDAIGAVIRDSEGRILVLDHVKFGVETIPIGKAHQGQSPFDALKEEMAEELGIEVQQCTEIVSSLIEYRDGRHVILRMHIFNVGGFAGEIQNLEPSKHRGFAFISVEDVANLKKTTDATILFLKALGQDSRASMTGDVLGKIQQS